MNAPDKSSATPEGRRLSRLPAPPAGRSGWPWDRETPWPEGSRGRGAWPAISIITPSYNQADFLEETLRSVLLQGYPDLEYIVLDGGSSDGSQEILRRYAEHLDFFRSAPDGGQAAAVAEGCRRARGDVLGYVNSDDILLPGALESVGWFFSRHAEVELAVGKSVLIDSSSRVTYLVPGLTPSFHSLLFWGSGGFNQPASFWRRDPSLAEGLFDDSLRFAFDLDLYLRLTRRRRASHIGHYLAAFRTHAASKTRTISDVRVRETALLRKKHGIGKFPTWFRGLAWGYYQGRYLISAGRLRLAVLFKRERPLREPASRSFAHRSSGAADS